MPGYIPTAFHRFQHKLPAHAQDAPNSWNKSVYDKHIQLATQQSSAPKLNFTDTNDVQSIKWTFLYYASAVYSTIISALKNISTYLSSLTQYIIAKYNKVLEYTPTHKIATIWYHARNAILITNTDADYLVIPAACSGISGNFLFFTAFLIILRVLPLQMALF